ncbi:hypothetical protein KVT40_007601 [Elsinoe batatas]|uniref:Uncharacterized protein n=1 Tax=Elsinoe batatas TaxID=2601811 RepID=A0A8K0KXD4_9PEZI|nr:hypothetical protein KVT40_007601 [Elsinoe batatas]
MAALRSPLAPSPVPAAKVGEHKAEEGLVGEGLSPRSADSLAPPSPYPAHVDPSPTESNGTDTTDIDDEAQDGINDHLFANDSGHGQEQGPGQGPPLDRDGMSPISPNSLAKLDTAIVGRGELGMDDAPTSVIHVSQGFKQFASPASPNSRVITKAESFIASPSTPDAAKGPDDKRLSGQSPGADNGSNDTINISAQKPARQDSVTESILSSRPTSSIAAASSHSSSLVRPSSDYSIHVINVNGDLAMSETAKSLDRVTEEVRGLRRALANCWSLCNTLADMSSVHRQRVFSNTPQGRLSNIAWNSCWRLCQQLYAHRETPLGGIEESIELCREFTQARFEARSKGDATSDSILRVSFEMNIHLYNVRDRSLPPSFVKRTMDFYIAFCHRLMKKRSSLPQDTEALLAACFALASSLYRLQHPIPDAYDDEQTEEELLTACLHAAFGLSDLLKESWSTSRASERGTPRPNQSSFPPRSSRNLTSSEGRTSSLSNRTYHDAPPYNPTYPTSSSLTNPAPPLPPETPITIFDDVTDSSSPESAQPPNILVLGPDAPRAPSSRQQPPRRSAPASAGPTTHHERWSSNASSLSSYTDSSSRNSSNRTLTETEHRHLRTFKALLLRVAHDLGFDPGKDNLVEWAREGWWGRRI